MTRQGRYRRSCGIGTSGWCWSTRTSIPRSGRRSAPSPTSCGVSAETLRKWVRRAETDEGLRPGLTSDERERLKTLERENRELRRTNEILKSAAARSKGRRNNRREPISRGLVLKGLSRPGVEPRSDGV